jgi:hypothetical protein
MADLGDGGHSAGVGCEAKAVDPARVPCRTGDDQLWSGEKVTDWHDTREQSQTKSFNFSFKKHLLF